MQEFNKDFDIKMQKTIEVVMSDFASVRHWPCQRCRSGQDHRGLLWYAHPHQPGGRHLFPRSPQPDDPALGSSLLKAIEKAIQVSDLGINPQNDGKVIRLLFPQLTEERRKELTKQVKKYAENGKIAVRNIRRDAMEKLKAAEKKGDMTEDDRKDCARSCRT